jgi:hypothetical protein
MTMRTKAQLDELFADNGEGLITPARLRDLVDSAALLYSFAFGPGTDGPLVVGAGQTYVNPRISAHTSIHVAAGGTLDLDGYPIMCQTPITTDGPTSIITSRAPQPGAPGTAVAGGLAGAFTGIRIYANSFNPGNGGFNGVGAVGGGSTGALSELPVPNGANGGAASGGQVGGLGGTMTTVNGGSGLNGITLMPLYLLRPQGGNNGVPLSGGGAGGGGGANGAGGGGGGQQSYGVCIFAPDIQGGGTILARGANGGDGFAGSGVGGGGGGGGAGGLVVIVDKVGALRQYVIDNIGGLGGLGGGFGAQPGQNGQNGPVLLRSV